MGLKECAISLAYMNQVELKIQIFSFPPSGTINADCPAKNFSQFSHDL